jgi:hypothetical protein
MLNRAVNGPQRKVYHTQGFDFWSKFIKLAQISLPSLPTLAVMAARPARCLDQSLQDSAGRGDLGRKPVGWTQFLYQTHRRIGGITPSR